MPLYDYSGQATSGTLFEGTLEAQDPASARLMLDRMGIRVGTLQTANRTAFVSPLSLDEFTFFNEQLAALTHAGLPLENGLRQLAADVGSRRLKRLILDLARDLAAGQQLPLALEKQAQRFPPGYPGVVRAALETGDMSGVLYALTSHLRVKSGFKRALIEVVSYPLIVMALAAIVASFLMRQVVPLVAELVIDLPREAGFGIADAESRPLIFALSHIWPAIELALAVLIGLLAAGAAAIALPGQFSRRERLLRALPGVSGVYWSSVLARFSHAAALAAHAGTPMPDLVRTSGRASGSPALDRSADQLAAALERGDPLGRAAEAVPDIPSLWTCAVEISGPRGDLPAVLSELARTYEQRAEQNIAGLRAILGPALLIFMAVTIGGLIAALLSAVAWLIRLLMSVTGY